MNEITKLSELAVYLKQVVATYSQHDYEQLYQELRARYEQQIMDAFMDRHPGWSVVEGDTACVMYLYRNWSFAEKAEENATQLMVLADDLIENYEECEKEYLALQSNYDSEDFYKDLYHIYKAKGETTKANTYLVYDIYKIGRAHV